MNYLLRSTSIAALAMAPFITGCATKKYVRTSVAPVEQKVGELGTTTIAQGKSIEELERGVARADERAQGAQGKADAANAQAELARREAAEGRTIAEKGVSAAEAVGKNLTTMGTTINGRLENIHNVKMVSNDQVLFASGKHELDADSMETLDAMVAKSGSLKNFLVEVQGFTDTTGSKQLNLELSRKRADAVVRYLSVKHNIPLHRIFVAGFGTENQVADNKTRDGRKQNRRVELKIYVPADQATSTVSSIPGSSN